MKNNGKFVVFDGACGLCHAWVRFVIRHDKQHIFKFTSMQSVRGQAILQRLNRPIDNYETMFYVENGLVYEKSRAFLKIVRLLPMPIKLLSCIYIIPGFMRDIVYDRIARSRYKIFGEREECSLTEGNFRDRFL